MIHAIEFRRVVLAEVDRPEYAYQQLVVIRERTRLHAHIKPIPAIKNSRQKGVD